MTSTIFSKFTDGRKAREEAARRAADEVEERLARTRRFIYALDAAGSSTVSTASTDADIDARVARALEAVPQVSGQELRAQLLRERQVHRSNAEHRLKDLARKVERLTDELAAATRSRDVLIRSAGSAPETGGWLGRHELADRSRLDPTTLDDILGNSR